MVEYPLGNVSLHIAFQTPGNSVNNSPRYGSAKQDQQGISNQAGSETAPNLVWNIVFGAQSV
jgi:hypothetical protein